MDMGSMFAGTDGAFGSPGYLADVAGTDARTAANAAEAREPGGDVVAFPGADQRQDATVRIVPNEEDVLRARQKQAEEEARAAARSTLSGISADGVPYGAPLGALTPTQMTWGTFGAVASSAVILSALGGFALDKAISKRVGVPGYGPLIGAVGGVAIVNAIAALATSRGAALSSVGGSALALAPAFVAMKMGHKIGKGNTKIALGAAATGILLFAFRSRLRRLV